MALLALHGDALPQARARAAQRRGRRGAHQRDQRALQPHAGGVIVSWSEPIAGRDPRRPGHRHPRTPTPSSFMRYNLAGAYDSNIALLLTAGESRTRRARAPGRDPAPHRAARRRPRDQPAGPLRPAELVPRPRRDGEADDAVHELLPRGGRRARQGRRATSTSSTRWTALLERADDREARAVLELKQTLLARPIERLLDRAAPARRLHRPLSTGRTSRATANATASSATRSLLAELYHYLHLEDRGQAARRAT